MRKSKSVDQEREAFNMTLISESIGVQNRDSKPIQEPEHDQQQDIVPTRWREPD